MILSDIAAENRHRAHADGEREESLVHRADDNRAGDLRKIRHQIERQALFRARKREAVNGQHDHQHKQQRHHDLGDALQAALQMEAEDAEGEHHRNRQIGHIQAGIPDHADKADICGLSGQKTHKIVDDPARDNGIERHQRHIAEERDIAMPMPFLPGALNFLIHVNGAGLRRAADSELHRHHRQPKHQQAEDIQQHKAASAVLPAHPRKFPHVSASDRTAGRQQYEPQPRSQSFSLHETSLFLFLY